MKEPTSVSILFVEQRKISKQLYHGKVKYYGKFQREIIRFAEINENAASPNDFEIIHNYKKQKSQ